MPPALPSPARLFILSCSFIERWRISPALRMRCDKWEWLWEAEIVCYCTSASGFTLEVSAEYGIWDMLVNEKSLTTEG